MTERGVVARAVRFSVAHPILVLGVLCLLQVIPTLGSREYWAFDEVRHAEALRNLLEEGHWFSLHLNGVPYPDKPPVYFWLAAGSAKLLGTDGPPAFFLVSGLGGFLFLVATWGLARATILAREPALALLAPLLVSVTPLFQLLLRTTRMDLLFGALIVSSTTCLWRGLGPDSSRRGTIVGFALAGLATLVKGPVGLALPLVSAVLYLVWTGRARRLLGWDVFVGLGLAMFQIVGWAVGIALVEGGDYLRDLLGSQVVARAVSHHKHAQPFFYYLPLLPLAFLPWTGLLAAFPWSRLARKETWRRIWAGRRSDAAGRSWVTWTFLGGLLLLTLATSKLLIYLMPLLAPLAVLGAGRLARLGMAGARVWTFVGAYLVVVAFLTLLLEPLANGVLDLAIPPPRGAGIAAAVFGATGLGVLWLRRRPLVQPLLVTLAGLLVANLLLALFVAPSLDPVMSPRPQAELIARHVERGYRPLVFRVYPGTYSYYARQALPETRDPTVLRAHVETDQPILLAMAKKYWTRHASWLADFEFVHEQRIEGRPYVVGIRGALDAEGPEERE